MSSFKVYKYTMFVFICLFSAKNLANGNSSSIPQIDGNNAGYPPQIYHLPRDPVGEANQQIFQDCSTKEDAFKELKKQLVECRGGRDNCLKAAKDCHDQFVDGDFQEDDSNSKSKIVVNSLLGVLGGSSGNVGFPPLVTKSQVQCMKKEDVKTAKEDLKDLYDKAKAELDDAKSMSKALEEDKKGLLSKKTDITKSTQETITEINGLKKKLAGLTIKYKDLGNQTSFQIMQNLLNFQRQLTEVRAGRDTNQAKITILYPELIKVCVDQLNVSRDQSIERLSAIVEINNRNTERKKILAKLKLDNNSCIASQARAYQIQASQIQETIKSANSQIDILNSQIEKLKADLKAIPQSIVQAGIDQETSDINGQIANASNRMNADYTGFQSEVNNFMRQYQKAQNDLTAKESKFNAINIKNQKEQALYQMRVFGDAEAIIEDYEQAKKDYCSACNKKKEIIKGAALSDCPDSSDLGNEGASKKTN